jgi:hypothetical protein
MKTIPCKKISPTSYILWTLTGMAFLLLAASPALCNVTQTAVVATVAADWSSSAVAVAPVDSESGQRTAQDGLLIQDNSDITLSTHGRYFYLLTRGTSNTVAKIDADSPGTVIWQYSTEGDEFFSNPYQLVIVNSEKAYLLRYGSSTAWIVNPSAETEEDFKIGELDLSAYDEGDGVPEMAGGVIAHGKLFVMMQRLNYWAPSEIKPYIAVFDVDTDEEIDTAMGEGGLKGIALEIKDPLSIQYLPENDTVYVQGLGYYPGYGYPDYEDDGGIVAIDAYDYSTTLVLDDGEGENMPYGQISGMSMVSSTKGYFVGYDGWGDNTLYTFDPSAENPVGTAVTGLQNKSIAGMESGIYVDKNGMLWVCNQTDVRVDILDTETDTIEESVSTALNPSRVVFTVKGYLENDDNDNGIADAQEASVPVDLNGDGVDDEITDTYKFLQTEVGECYVALEAGENVNEILAMASIDPADALSDTTGIVPGDMPYGLLDFSLDVPTGATVLVTLYFSEALETTEWYKYSQAAGWEDYSAYAVFYTPSDGGTEVTLTLEDGGIGDADGIANGIIVDPSGPGADAIDSTGDSGDTGSSDDSGSGSDSSTCFITSVSDSSAMPSSAVALLGLVMLVAALPALRRLRK